VDVSVRDLSSPAVIHAKGALFVVLGALSGLMVLAESPTAKTAALLAICSWASARAYYCAFYVVEKYVDSSFRYSGLASLLRYAIGRAPGGEHDRRATPHRDVDTGA
jgi:hypothetical protein